MTHVQQDGESLTVGWMVFGHELVLMMRSLMITIKEYPSVYHLLQLHGILLQEYEIYGIVVSVMSAFRDIIGQHLLVISGHIS